MVTKKQLDKLKEVSQNEEIKEKWEEIRSLNRRDPSQEVRKLRSDINELASDLLMGEGEQSDIIQELQDKKTTLEILENKDEQTEDKIGKIKAEIEEMKEEHKEEIEQAVVEITAPIWKELFEMVERAIELNKELRQVEKAVNNSKPKNLKFHDITGRKNAFPFDVINQGRAGANKHPKLYVREEEAQAKGLI